MKTFRQAAIALTATLAAASAVQAAPMRYTFYDCGGYADCRTETPTVMAQFTTRGVIQAPAVPPAGTFTPAEEIPVERKLAGDWDDLGISTFNANGAIGSLFLLFNFDAANDRAFSPVMAFGAAFPQALRLVWSEGTYMGLAYVNCYNVSCTSQTPIRGYAKLMAEIWTDDTTTGTVPEPGALGLALAALGLAAGLGRRRAA